jgi:hypothetical protein
MNTKFQLKINPETELELLTQIAGALIESHAVKLSAGTAAASDTQDGQPQLSVADLSLKILAELRRVVERDVAANPAQYNGLPVDELPNR